MGQPPTVPTPVTPTSWATMMQSRALPQMPADVDDALGLVCTLPGSERADRRISIRDIISQATGWSELETGVTVRFDGSDEAARLIFDLILAERVCCAQFSYTMGFAPQRGALELRVEAPIAQRQALKDLYLTLAREAGIDG